MGSIEVQPEPPEISCDNCFNSACCKGPMWIDLTIDEASFMLKGGNKLITIDSPKDHDREVATPVVMSTKNGKAYALPDVVPKGMGRYVMSNDCAYLQTDESGNSFCGAYDERPFACRKFPVAEEGCVKFRQIFGVDPVEPGGAAEQYFELLAQLEATD